MNNLKVLTLDSREVAEIVSKRHTDLLRDLEKYSGYLKESTERKIALSEFWQESSYKDITGRTLKCYLITKKGCEFIAHKMTGRKGALFTATYINRFHEMEQALKERQSAAPAPVLKRVAYKGQIMMTAVDLSALSGIHNATLQRKAKKHKLPYILLTGEDVKTFKAENHLRTGASRIVLYPRDTVVSLLMLWNLYSKFKNVILDYFKTAASDAGKSISLQGGGIDQKIKKLEQEAATLDGLIQNLTSYRRTKEKHIEYIGVALEFAADLFTNIHRLRDKVTALEA